MSKSGPVQPEMTPWQTTRVMREKRIEPVLPPGDGFAVPKMPENRPKLPPNRAPSIEIVLNQAGFPPGALTENFRRAI